MNKNNFPQFLEITMSGDHLPDVGKLEVNEEVDSTYRPPPEKSLDELINTDKDDESLKKYKEKLLGEATAGKVIVGMYYFCSHILRAYQATTNEI